MDPPGPTANVRAGELDIPPKFTKSAKTKNGLTRINGRMSTWIMVSCLLCTFVYFRAAAKSREGLVDDPGTKTEKEEAAVASYKFRNRLAQSLAKRYPS